MKSDEHEESWRRGVGVGCSEQLQRLTFGFFLYLIFNIIRYFWIKYDLGQKYYATEVRPDRGSNS